MPHALPKKTKDYTADEQAVLRHKCTSDFKFFVRYMFWQENSQPFMFSWHHHEICDTLIRVFNGEITHLLVNMPPRYSKTEIIVKLFSAWCILHNPSSEFIHLSYANDLALGNSDAIKSIVKSETFRILWPEIKISLTNDAKGEWKTTDGGVFYATSSGGAVTGFGAGKVNEFDANGNFVFSGAIIIDDPLKPDDAVSDTKRQTVNDRWDTTVKSRKNSDSTPVIVVMQRLHDDDYSAMLIADEEFDWHILELPAILDEGTDSERPLWPEKHSLERLQQMRTKKPYVFSGQYMQRPSPLGGGIFKDGWWRYYTGLVPFEYRVIVGDTAMKAKEHNDYSVFQCWGVTKDGLGYLIDQVRGKWEAPELERQAVAFWQKHRASTHTGKLRYFGIEDKSSGAGLIQGLKTKHRIPMHPIQVSNDKVTRALDASPYIENGFVYIPDNADFLSDFTAEFSAFTANDTHKHDDQIDTTVHFINEFLSGKATQKFTGAVKLSGF